MELRTIVFSLMAGLVAFLLTAGAVSILALSGHVTPAPDTLVSVLMDFLPALALGITAGLMSRSEPALHALVASLLSWAFFAALFFATVHHFHLGTRLSASELLSGYLAPLLVAMLAALLASGARSRRSAFRADSLPPRGRERR